FTLLLIPMGFSTVIAQDFPHINKRLNIEARFDTVAQMPKNEVLQDTIQKDSVTPPRGQRLEDLMYRNAKDYEKFDQKTKRLTLYNEAEFKYQDYELTAGIIIYDYDKEEVYAGRIKDSLGNLVQRPVFKQGGQVSETDSILFNSKTKKAILRNTRLTYIDSNIKAEKTKNVDDPIYCMRDVINTRDEYGDHREYYSKTNTTTIVPNKKVVTGVTTLVLEAMPRPIGLPTAFSP